MKILIVIPARMASTRFPNKPMALINKKPMILHVWERAKESNLGKVLVACCEQDVADCIRSVGGEAILTDPYLPSGTDRVYAAIENDDDFFLTDSIINLQGDMPLIDSYSINEVNKTISKLIWISFFQKTLNQIFMIFGQLGSDGGLFVVVGRKKNV